MAKYSILKRLSYVPSFGSAKPGASPEEQALFPFDDQEVETLNKVWDGAWILNAEHGKNGIHLVTQEGGNVHIQRDRVTVSANAENATLRSLVLHAKENWNNSFRPLGETHNEEQLGQVWAHCQVHGVKFGWEPPPHMREKLKSLVEQLNHDEQLIESSAKYPSYGKDGLKYRAPVLDAVKIPGAGSRPNHTGLKAGSLAEQAGIETGFPKLSSALNGIAEQATARNMAERSAFLKAREAGQIKTSDIQDWGARIRMTSSDRVAARQKSAQTQRPLPGMHL